MKLNEITGEDSTPLLIILMQQLLKKGERIAWFPTPDENEEEEVTPRRIVKIKRKAPLAHNASFQWVFTYAGNSNRHAINRIEKEKDFNDRFELVPSKTRGTWWFRNRIEQIKESRGEDLVSYLEFAEASLTKQQCQYFDKLAHRLFQRGFSFIRNPESSQPARFIKKDNDKKVKVTIFCGKLGRILNQVMVTIYPKDKGWFPDMDKTYDIKEMITSEAVLDSILQCDL